jgi:hypothetical protein
MDAANTTVECVEQVAQAKLTNGLQAARQRHCGNILNAYMLLNYIVCA